MIKRIVKLTFQPDKVDDFISLFNDSKEKIKSSDGCIYLELLRLKPEGSIFFTLSWWESESHLNAYRNSDLFAATWKKTKSYFSGKPEAWTVESLYRSQ